MACCFGLLGVPGRYLLHVWVLWTFRTGQPGAMSLWPGRRDAGSAGGAPRRARGRLAGAARGSPGIPTLLQINTEVERAPLIRLLSSI